MLERNLRLGAALCMLAVALVFLADMLTLQVDWRRRRRPKGLELNQRLGVAIGLGLLAVTIVLVAAAASVMV